MRADGLLLLSEEVESAIRQVLCADLQPLREQSTSLSIEQEDAVNLPYSTFFSQFLVPNRYSLLSCGGMLHTPPLNLDQYW